MTRLKPQASFPEPAADIVPRHPVTWCCGVCCWLLLLTLSVSLAGCAGGPDTVSTGSDLLSTENPGAALPDSFQIPVGQLLVHSDIPIAESHRLFVELKQLREDLVQELGVVPSDETIHVFLFNGPDSYRDYCRSSGHPLANRRAFFMQTDTTLSVYAAWSDKVATDLRHELTHAYLHSSVPRLPLWLDEGIAEYFEVEPGQDGWNLVHVHQLEKEALTPLEDLEQLADPAAMRQIHYASSWAWVHFLLRHDAESKSILHHHLQQWRAESKADRLSALIAEKYPDAEMVVKNRQQ